MARIGKTNIIDTVISETTGDGAIVCHVRVIRTGVDSPLDPLPKQDDFWFEVPIGDGWALSSLDAAMITGAITEAGPSTGLQVSEIINMNRIRDPFTEMAKGGLVEIPWHSDGSLGLAFSNSPLNERFALNQPTRFIKLLPLGRFSEVRMVGHLATPSASGSTPRCRLVFNPGAYSATLGSFSPIGSSEVSISFAAAGGQYKDTGWVPLVDGARADVFVGLTELGGTGAISPVLGHLSMFYR